MEGQNEGVVLNGDSPHPNNYVTSAHPNNHVITALNDGDDNHNMDDHDDDKSKCAPQQQQIKMELGDRQDFAPPQDLISNPPPTKDGAEEEFKLENGTIDPKMAGGGGPVRFSKRVAATKRKDMNEEELFRAAILNTTGQQQQHKRLAPSCLNPHTPADRLTIFIPTTSPSAATAAAILTESERLALLDRIEPLKERLSAEEAKLVILRRLLAHNRRSCARPSEAMKSGAIRDLPPPFGPAAAMMDFEKFAAAFGAATGFPPPPLPPLPLGAPPNEANLKAAAATTMMMMMLSAANHSAAPPHPPSSASTARSLLTGHHHPYVSPGSGGGPAQPAAKNLNAQFDAPALSRGTPTTSFTSTASAPLVSKSQSSAPAPSYGPSLKQQQAAAKLALRKQLEKTLLQIPPPKPPPPHIAFVPNGANTNLLIYLAGVEAVTRAVLTFKRHSRKHPNPTSAYLSMAALWPLPPPHKCAQCGTDFSPIWQAEEQTRPEQTTETGLLPEATKDSEPLDLVVPVRVICESCATANQKRSLKAQHTARLKAAFVKALQQEQEIERQMMQQHADLQKLTAATLATSANSTSSSSKKAALLTPSSSSTTLKANKYARPLSPSAPKHTHHHYNNHTKNGLLVDPSTSFTSGSNNNNNGNAHKINKSSHHPHAPFPYPPDFPKFLGMNMNLAKLAAAHPSGPPPPHNNDHHPLAAAFNFAGLAAVASKGLFPPPPPHSFPPFMAPPHKPPPSHHKAANRYTMHHFDNAPSSSTPPPSFWGGGDERAAAAMNFLSSALGKAASKAAATEMTGSGRRQTGNERVHPSPPTPSSLRTHHHHKTSS